MNRQPLIHAHFASFSDRGKFLETLWKGYYYLGKEFDVSYHSTGPSLDCYISPDAFEDLRNNSAALIILVTY